MKYYFYIVFVTLFCSSIGYSQSVIGGGISWKCAGKGYVFKLQLYRSCGQAVIEPNQVIKVWNHPFVNSIPVRLTTRTDVSPKCTALAGGPSPFTCANGNGDGALEELNFESEVIFLDDAPTGQSWGFTYEYLYRSKLATNINVGDNSGITLTATLFPNTLAKRDECYESSPQFANKPFLIACTRDDVNLSMHAFDTDYDSLSYQFSVPLDRFLLGGYNPPTNPKAVPFISGYTMNSPTPDQTFSPNNKPITIHKNSGQIQFRADQEGGYALRIKVKSFRQKSLISEIDREVLILTRNCSVGNSAPQITSTLTPAFETTVLAGDPVSFPITITDAQSTQNVRIDVTGMEIGNPVNSTSGCEIEPCASLNQPVPITIQNQATINLNWQTTCNHLKNRATDLENQTDYFFLVSAEDDACPITKFNQQIFTVHVKNPKVITSMRFKCIETLSNGDLFISWTPANNSTNTFSSYELFSDKRGSLGTYSLNDSSVTISSNKLSENFTLRTFSGCNGTYFTDSDTISNVVLDLQDLANGFVQLDWNNPRVKMPNTTRVFIERKQLDGTWLIIDSLFTNNLRYRDSIDVCGDSLTYRVHFSGEQCNYFSNIIGGVFKDIISPFIPNYSSVSIDTLTGNPILTWSVNRSSDTYGYVIYKTNADGFLVEIDTVFGRYSTKYTDLVFADTVYSYSIAAFDFCFTDATPPTYQTSAKGKIHSSMVLKAENQDCTNEVILKWTPYIGWDKNLAQYFIWAKIDGKAWKILDSTQSITKTVLVDYNKEYIYAVQAIHTNGATSFSVKDTLFITGPTQPTINYFSLASVTGKSIEFKYQLTREYSELSHVRIEKWNPKKERFEKLVDVPTTSDYLIATDNDVVVKENTYTYRGVLVDKCGRDGVISNEVTTILLKVETDQTNQRNFLFWTEYIGFQGEIYSYEIYRSVNGVFDTNPIAILPTNQRTYQDDVSSLYTESGEICYYIKANEGSNLYQNPLASNSNIVCVAIEPLVYIPTAFTPGGHNPIYKPYVSFSDVNSFQFSIVDRLGREVFYSTDPTIGWDGNHKNGEQAATGVYVYVLRIQDGLKQDMEFRGHLTLLR